MTKRSVISVVAILAAIVLAFGMAATACGHEHTFASAWETDATHHWHACHLRACRTEKADLGEHVPAAPVRENEIAATCTADGSYDEVVYCADCHYEIDREEKTIVAAHSYGEDNICKVCGHGRATEGLRFTLNGDERSYTCSGIGTAEGAEIYIPAEYDGKPVTGIREYGVRRSLRAHVDRDPRERDEHRPIRLQRSDRRYHMERHACHPNHRRFRFRRL